MVGARLDLAPQSAGLYAISLGLSRVFSDDHEMLRHGLVIAVTTVAAYWVALALTRKRFRA